jgi:hypothetical protein
MLLLSVALSSNVLAYCTTVVPVLDDVFFVMNSGTRTTGAPLARYPQVAFKRVEKPNGQISGTKKR